MEKIQIVQKMAKVLIDYTKKNHITASTAILTDYAEELYEEGYRKQEWISVDERLPECTMLCLVHCVHSYCDYDEYSNITIKVFANGEFGIENAYKVTHWMPLPEAPKGGAE